jgi:membrane protease YdiL (CAAX protease family)
MENNTKIHISFSTKLIVLISFFALFLLAASALLPIVAKSSGNQDNMMRMSIIIEDVLAFILPAILTAKLISRHPTQQLRLDKGFSWKILLLVTVVYFVSLPVMNYIIDLNKAMTLPSYLHNIEQWMRASEDSATKVTDELLNIHSIGMLLAMVGIVGILTAFSEEIFFRGAMLGIFLDRPVKLHVAVWTVAIIFSAMHMQFFGFLPRMLLGAWLGYLLVWTRSLWAPIFAHALNNGMTVLYTYISINLGNGNEWYNNVGVSANGEFPFLALASAVVTAAAIVLTIKLVKANKATKSSLTNTSQEVSN